MKLNDTGFITRRWKSRPTEGSMMWVGIATAVGAGGKMILANQAQKGAEGTANNLISNTPQIDPNQVNQTATNLQFQNAGLSNQLEQMYNPALNALRGAAGNNLLGQLNNVNSFTTPGGAVNTPQGASSLTAAAQQYAARNMQNPYGLPQDVANQIMRSSAAQAGSVVGSGNGLGLLGRDLSARDLGLNSLQLGQQNFTNAAGLGGQADQLALLQNQQRFNQLFQNNQTAFQNALGSTGMANSFQMPQVGLSPTAVANIYGGNANAMANAQAMAAGIMNQGNQAQNSLWGGALGNLTSLIGGLGGASGGANSGGPLVINGQNMGTGFKG